MMSKMMIQIENLYRTFHHGSNEVPVLKEINLNIRQGECVVLKGVSGSGKTTLLSLIAGLDKPSAGKVLIEGEPISKLPDLFASELRAKKIGMIFQHFTLFEHLSVSENVTIPLIPSGLNMNEVIWPWNIALILMLWLAFWKVKNSKFPVYIGRFQTGYTIILFLFYSIFSSLRSNSSLSREFYRK